MTSYSRIMLPLDESQVSEQAIPFAVALAGSLSLPVTLIEAVEPDSPAITQSLYSNRRWMASASTREDRAREYLASISARLLTQGLQADIAVPRMEPASGIVEESARDADALIVMASHGRSGLARWWMGSVADKVLHTAGNPMIVIRAQGQATSRAARLPERLIVPLDGSELAELVLPHAVYLAKALRLPVKLLQITPSEEEYYRYAAMGPGAVPSAPPSNPPIAEIVQIASQEAQGYLEDVSRRLNAQGVGSVEIDVAQGNAAEAIVDMATAEQGSLVAMTTHGRSGVGRMMLGSVAERVVRQSGCPVLVVRAG